MYLKKSRQEKSVKKPVVSEKAVLESLEKVLDPELNLNIVELGLVYGVEILDNGKRVRVRMTLTTPFCPMANEIVDNTRNAAKSTPGVEEAEVELTFEPKWTADKITPEARDKLGFVF